MPKKKTNGKRVGEINASNSDESTSHNSSEGSVENSRRERRANRPRTLYPPEKVTDRGSESATSPESDENDNVGQSFQTLANLEMSDDSAIESRNGESETELDPCQNSETVPDVVEATSITAHHQGQVMGNEIGRVDARK